MSSPATAKALMDIGGPPLLAEWLLGCATDLETARRRCPRADWLVWLAAVAGAPSEQLVRAGAAAVRTVLPLAPGAEWPLVAALASVDGAPIDPALLPTWEEMALTIARLRGTEQRVALAVRSVCKAVVSHRTLIVRMMATVVRSAALLSTEARHGELAGLSTRETARLLDRAFRSSSEIELVGGRGPAAEPLPLGIVAGLRQLCALAATVRSPLD